MSLSTDLSFSKGGMTKLPEGTHGNFPERVAIAEVYEREDGFTAPPLLTKSQLLEQLGPELYNKDVLWFLYDVRHFPCVRKFAAMTTLSSVTTSLLLYYGSRTLPLRKIVRYGGAAGAVAGIASLGHCLFDHFDMWSQNFALRSQFRDKRSYSVPESIQRSRDMEKYQEAHQDEIMTLQREMMEEQKIAARAAQKERQQNAGASIVSQFHKTNV